MLAALLPTALLAWYLADPTRNQPIVIKLEHFVKGKANAIQVFTLS
jgi:hypothetical protein